MSATAPGTPVGHLSVFLPHYGKPSVLGSAQPHGYLFVNRMDYWPGSLRRYDATGNLLSDDGARDVWGVFGLPGGGGVLDVAEGYAPNHGDGVPHVVWVGADGARGADVSGAWPITVGTTGGVLAMEGGKLRWYGPDGAARTDAFTDADLLSLLQRGGTGAEVRQDWLAGHQSGRFAAHLEAVAVQVVALGVDEAQFHPLVVAVDQAGLERLAHRQEVAAVVQRCGAAEYRAGPAVEQPGGGRQDEQQQEQGQQTTHRSLSFGEAGMIPERTGANLRQTAVLFCRRPARPCFIVERNVPPCEWRSARIRFSVS